MPAGKLRPNNVLESVRVENNRLGFILFLFYFIFLYFILSFFFIILIYTKKTKCDIT